MLVLGIETSCDETAAALVTEDGTVVSDSVHSQITLHAPYGGVVPELASRDHLRNVRPVIREVFRKAGLEPSAISGIAVTCRPGLSGALLVGVQAAKGLAFALDKPVVGVDHLIGHLLAVFLKFPGAPLEPPAEYPFVALLASGGHTALYRVAGPALDQISELGATRDDAAGECFDKVGKLLGLGYPGGPVIDKLAKDGNPDAIELAWPMRRKGSLEFSFSGLKSNMLRWVNEHGLPQDEQTQRNLCAAFQRRVVDTLIWKALEAARAEGVRTLVLAGGVAANRELRQRSAEQAAPHGIRVVVPPFKACTDNASMIAYAGLHRLARGDNDAQSLTMSPHTSLPQSTKKGRGKREN
ncbi:MAG TPA: tRNA (adenosine(37)-N6)-threonylcarbamoyltransferase complex transferase subunit TsaD [Polyangiaceae bacterium]|jgi:N6-L-threonylcarbamoyladenine synthase|nr:tRNA (adenosine(37)-N6)-threonylcarbamoyltransferase complex transferase subunit TsaD [Polyangiaceae bacterium]